MKKPKQAELLPVPPPWDSPDFLSAWSDWESFRKEIRKPVTPTVQRIQFSKLKLMGKACAIESIHQSINSGWQGLFEPKGGANGSSAEPERPQALPPCADWRERAARLRGGKAHTLTWETYATNPSFEQDILNDLAQNP